MNSKTMISKVGIKASHRNSLQKNLLSDLIIYEHLTTTKQKSKLVVGEFDKLVKIAKSDKNALSKARLLKQKVANDNAVSKLIEVYAKRFEKEVSGLVKVYKLGQRKGDSSDVVKLMVKGYEYKEIGKKVQASKKRAEKEVEEKSASKKDFNISKDQKGHAQVAGNVSAAKIKTRSGI